MNIAVRINNIQKRGFILGYPEVIYGYKPFGRLESAQDARLTLPLRIADFPQLSMETAYRIDDAADPNLPLDLAFDLWLTKDPRPDSIRKGDIELMIWLFHRNLKPAGVFLKDSRAAIPTQVQGETRALPWAAYLSNVDSPTRTSILVSFVLDINGEATQSDGGISSGLVAVSLKAIFDQMVEEVVRNVGWSRDYVRGLYVNDIELGTEFGSRSDRASFSWTLSHYSFIF